MNNLRLLLSFDHELSLGGARSYAQNLFDPTDRLLDLADELQVPVTLFTDVCCAIRFRDWNHEDFYRPYRRQIERAVDRGHDVQLHLHPHWIDSEFENGRFIPADAYSLGCFRDRAWPDNITGIVERGTDFLYDLCRARRGDYRCIAYRAGGFSLLPETAAILTALFGQGIRIDSSIAKEHRFACRLWDVDFHNMPDRANWYIATTGPLNREAPCGLYEIPIATRPRTPLNNVPFLVKRVLWRRRRYSSGGWSIDVGNTPLTTKLIRLLPHSAWMLGFDNHTDSIADLMKTLRYHVKRHAKDELIACSTLSHPKFMGEHSRQLMKEFITRVRSEYGSQAGFCTFREFYDEFLRSSETAHPTESVSPKSRLPLGEG